MRVLMTSEGTYISEPISSLQAPATRWDVQRGAGERSPSQRLRSSYVPKKSMLDGTEPASAADTPAYSPRRTPSSIAIVFSACAVLVYLIAILDWLCKRVLTVSSLASVAHQRQRAPCTASGEAHACSDTSATPPLSPPATSTAGSGGAGPACAIPAADHVLPWTTGVHTVRVLDFWIAAALLYLQL